MRPQRVAQGVAPSCVLDAEVLEVLLLQSELDVELEHRQQVRGGEGRKAACRSQMTIACYMLPTLLPAVTCYVFEYCILYST